MMRRSVATTIMLGLMLVALASSLMSPTTMGAQTGLHITTTSHGLRLTLTLPESSYPQGALAMATMSLKNVSHHTVTLCVFCSKGYMDVRVLSGAGHVVYPPPVPQLVPLTGPPPLPLLLRAGKTMRVTTEVIFRGARIRAFAALEGNTIIRTRLVSIPLLPATPPAISVTQDGVPRVSVTPPAPMQGPLYYSYIFQCATGGDHPGIETASDYWVTSNSTEFELTRASDCVKLQQLHVVAGWMGQPVAEYHWVAP